MDICLFWLVCVCVAVIRIEIDAASFYLFVCATFGENEKSFLLARVICVTPNICVYVRFLSSASLFTQGVSQQTIGLATKKKYILTNKRNKMK